MVKNESAKDFKISGSWKRQSKLLREKFCQLTNADVKFEKGKDEELLLRIESRLNKSRTEVINLIKNCMPI